MPYASRRDPDDLAGLAAALEALVGTEYEEQVFVWVDGTPEGRSLDVVHSTDQIDGQMLAPRASTTPPQARIRAGAEIDAGAEDDPDEDDDWAEPSGRYLVYVGYAPGPPFAERAVPVPAGTELVDDDGTGATVALPALAVDAVVELVGSWARAMLGGASIGGLWWATTFADDLDADADDGDGDSDGDGDGGATRT